MGIDITLFHFFNSLPHNPVLDGFFTWLHYLTREGIIYYPFLIFCLFSRDARKNLFGRLGFVSLLITYTVVDLVLKNVFHRGRPFEALAGTIYLPPAPANYSFPSGQAAAAFALATTFHLIFPRNPWRWMVWAFAILVAFDRMYLGHHYPSDVLAGGLVGATISILVYRYQRIFFVQG